MCDSWTDSREKYSWSVDLSNFKNARHYPNYFNCIITPKTIVAFEDKFRVAINGAGSFEVAGEVCFWKNYGNALARDRITQALFTHPLLSRLLFFLQVQ